MAVAIEVQPRLSAGSPRALFAGRYATNVPARAYDVTPDGQRFLLIRPEERPADRIGRMHIIQNWHDELTRLVPVR